MALYSNKEIGQNIRRIREGRSMTAEQVAFQLGMTKSNYSKYERGLIKRIDREFFIKLSAILMCPVRDLTGHNDADPPVYDNATTITGSARGEVIRPKSIPILGTIAAGTPLYAEQYVEGYIAVPPHWPVNYALRVKGESMIGAGIPDGSLVLCKAQQDVDNGQIAVCIVDGEEATLKRVRRYGDVLVLQPENPAFEERTFAGENKDQVTIQGLAIKVIKDVM